MPSRTTSEESKHFNRKSPPGLIEMRSADRDSPSAIFNPRFPAFQKSVPRLLCSPRFPHHVAICMQRDDGAMQNLRWFRQNFCGTPRENRQADDGIHSAKEMGNNESRSWNAPTNNASRSATDFYGGNFPPSKPTLKPLKNTAPPRSPTNFAGFARIIHSPQTAFQPTSGKWVASQRGTRARGGCLRPPSSVGQTFSDRTRR